MFLRAEVLEQCLSQVPDLVVHEEEVYEDEDDENEEGNWRNDYPDEESDSDGGREERYGGTYRVKPVMDLSVWPPGVNKQEVANAPVRSETRRW